MKLNLLPAAAVERLIRAAGAHRVSATASEELAKHLEKYGIEIATRANRLAIHANRTTVKGEDIVEALEQMK
jgi:histone H3/H4